MVGQSPAETLNKHGSKLNKILKRIDKNLEKFAKSYVLPIQKPKKEKWNDLDNFGIFSVNLSGYYGGDYVLVGNLNALDYKRFPNLLKKFNIKKFKEIHKESDFFYMSISDNPKTHAEIGAVNSRHFKDWKLVYQQPIRAIDIGIPDSFGKFIEKIMNAYKI